LRRVKHFRNLCRLICELWESWLDEAEREKIKAEPNSRKLFKSGHASEPLNPPSLTIVRVPYYAVVFLKRTDVSNESLAYCAWFHIARYDLQSSM
jgi:hypothetical protein